MRALQQRDVLIVLDNCEHLLDAVAAVVDEILDGCPGVRILATSRESLSVTGERVWRVPMLDDDTALALVLDRARAQNAVFDLSEQERVVAVEMCHRLDCLPLAIELAAARFATMSVADVAARLDDRFRLLAGRGRRHDRHATMRATLDWSYDLLDDDERLVLDRLSVFVGGFGLEAAEQVCADVSMASMRVIDLLGSLVDKSLVVAGDRNGRRRFDLLETVRAYAAERLAARGETEVMRTAHAKWCRGFAGRDLGGDCDRVEYRRRGGGRIRQLPSCTRLGHARPKRPKRRCGSLRQLAMSWPHYGKAAEALRRCEAALALPGGSALARHLCTAAAVQGAVWLFEREKAWKLALEALATIEASGAPPYLAWMMAAFARVMIGDSPEGPSLHEIIEQMRMWALDERGVASSRPFRGPRIAARRQRRRSDSLLGKGPAFRRRKRLGRPASAGLPLDHRVGNGATRRDPRSHRTGDRSTRRGRLSVSRVAVVWPSTVSPSATRSTRSCEGCGASESARWRSLTDSAHSQQPWANIAPPRCFTAN